MEVWYHAAERNPAVKTGGSFVDGVPFRGVLHTTESKSFAPSSTDYGGWHKSYPHFTLVERSGGVTMYQHIPIDTAARALRNARGGVQTNRARAIQIEIVGRAAESAQMPEAKLDALSRWMRWVEEQTGVRRKAPLEFRGGEAYGLQGAGRMSNQDWLVFDSWCGHQHVPENTHWDPGKINIAELLRRGAVPEPAEVVPAPAVVSGAFYRVVGTDPDGLVPVAASPGGPVVFQLAGDAAGFRATGERADAGGTSWVEIVTATGSRGWVTAGVVAPGEAAAAYEVIGVRSDDVLNVRSGPGVGSDVVTEFPPGAGDIVVTGEAAMVGNDRWVRVTRTVGGWVNARYLESTAEDFGVDFAAGPEMDPHSHGDIGDED
jgi:hypothetical protein